MGSLLFSVSFGVSVVLLFYLFVSGLWPYTWIRTSVRRTAPGRGGIIDFVVHLIFFGGKARDTHSLLFFVALWYF